MECNAGGKTTRTFKHGIANCASSLRDRPRKIEPIHFGKQKGEETQKEINKEREALVFLALEDKRKEHTRKAINKKRKASVFLALENKREEQK